MELPKSKLKENYNVAIKKLEEKFEDATTIDVDYAALEEVQEILNTLSKKYQEESTLGASRYKLYEIQALLHYFNNRDEDAWDFINFAIETRGSSYAKAEKLKRALSQQAEVSSNQFAIEKSTKKMEGLEGWLALFILGVFISLAWNFINLIDYPSVISEVKTARHEAPALVDAVLPVLWFEVAGFVVLIGLAVAFIINVFQRKKITKNFAIILLVTALAYGSIDYAWAAHIANTYSIDFDAELEEAAGFIGRTLISCLVWIPYFLVSRRVKQTLTK